MRLMRRAPRQRVDINSFEPSRPSAKELVGLGGEDKVEQDEEEEMEKAEQMTKAPDGTIAQETNKAKGTRLAKEVGKGNGSRAKHHEVPRIAFVDLKEKLAPSAKPNGTSRVAVVDPKERAESNVKPHERSRVAVMVVAMASSGPKWHDAFGVLAYSVRKAFAKSELAVDLLAVTPNSIGSRERSILESMGFKVLPKPLPVPPEVIQSEYARNATKKSCEENKDVCIEQEMMKLYGLSFTEYKRVLICDGDLLFLQNVDDLLDGNSSLVQGTYDHELDFRDSDGFTNEASHIPLVNGGFVVVRPNLEDFEGMMRLAKEGDWRPGSGWKGEKVGWGYGGVGPQGLFAYYYNKDALAAGEVMVKTPDIGNNMTKRQPSSRVQPLDRSVYDVIETRDLRDALNRNLTSTENVKVFHFTGLCMKPWACLAPGSHLCQTVTEQWWQLQREFAASKGAPPPLRCAVGGRYTPIEHTTKIKNETGA